MKKLVYLLIFILTSCTNSIDVSYEVIEEIPNFYCINYNTKEIEEVYTIYEVNDYNDVFNLLTVNKNYLPLGYYSNGANNLGLVKSYTKDKNVYYEVDDYINYILDIELFNHLLSLNNKDLGYNTTYIIYKSEIISYI